MSTMIDETIDNLSSLADVEIEGSSDADYVAPSDFVEPPPADVYTFQRQDGDESPLKSGRSLTKDGKLMAWFNFKAAIVGGKFDGRTVFASANTYVGSRGSCSAADFIRAAKSPLRPTTLLAYEEAIGRAEVEKLTRKDAEGNRTETAYNPPLKALPAKVISPFSAKTTWEWTDSEGTVFLRGYGDNVKSPKKYQGPKINVKYVVDRATGKKVPAVGQVGPDGNEYGARLVITDFVVPKSGATVRVNSSGGVKAPQEG